MPCKPTKKMKIRIDDLVRKTLRDTYGRPCPVLGELGRRFLAPSKKSGWPYLRLLADTPKGLDAVFVSGWWKGEPRVTLNPAKRNTHSVKRLIGVLDRRKAREAKNGTPVVKFSKSLPVLPQ
jgi:hypothetical protein